MTELEVWVYTDNRYVQNLSVYISLYIHSIPGVNLCYMMLCNYYQSGVVWKGLIDKSYVKTQ